MVATCFRVSRTALACTARGCTAHEDGALGHTVRARPLLVFAVLAGALLTCSSTTLRAQARAAAPSSARAAQSTREFLGLGPAPDAAAAKRGAPVYAANCGFCHGPLARGA